VAPGSDEHSPTMPLTAGSDCEVAGLAQEGFGESWFKGRVVSLQRPPGARFAVVPLAEVTWVDFPDEPNEFFPLKSLRLRPPQPLLPTHSIPAQT